MSGAVGFRDDAAMARAAQTRPGLIGRLRGLTGMAGCLAGLVSAFPFILLQETVGSEIPGNPFLILIPAVLMASVLFRWQGGTAALAVTALYTDYYHLDPPGFLITTPSHIFAFALFLAVGAYVIILVHSLHMALGRQDRLLDDQARLVLEQESLVAQLLHANGVGAAAEREKDVLVKELNHRVKNAIASVASVGRQTMRNSATLEEFGASFDQRIHALARTQDLVSLNGYGAGCSLSEILDCELEPFRGKTPCNAGGPDIRLGPKSGMALGLALHEMATNAAKYGALSATGRALDVVWAASGDVLELDWVETVAEPPAEPRRKGYGSRLLDHTIRSLQGRTVRTVTPEGYRFRITMSLSALAS